MVIKARELGFKGIFIPEKNAPEGAVVDGIEVYPANHIGQIIDHVRGAKRYIPLSKRISPKKHRSNSPIFPRSAVRKRPKEPLKWRRQAAITCCSSARPAREKVCLQSGLPGILPDMTFEESIETTKIHSIAGVCPTAPVL